ncbi:glycosyltransferase 87 family protein [Gordonia sp. ABSL1-1]|uniref:glycosyltransferase 87 family protein n=1 Tax=Gordonia sp. ABSL1-1 TaxID=3053923 RepID=UPI002572701A|nr:glycosyltransferase 87 family protein [Gordonia sp. ABSL1-1]MDL9936024.1 glycosyltransferase 87 family protein [Gordonia sp. ABSL1-1]
MFAGSRRFRTVDVVGVIVLVLGLCRVFGQPWLWHIGDPKYWGPPVDLQVYRYGGQFLLHGWSLYEHDVPTINDVQNLPFTYPPFAAAVFVPLSWLPVRAISVLSMIVGCLLTWWLLRLLLRRVGCGDLSVGWSMILAGLAFQFEPVRVTLDLGQVNLILVALTVLDTIWDRRPAWSERYRGVLVGVAAAVKLTPMVVIVYFIARKDWRSAINVVLGFLGASAFAWAISPSDSFRYWTETLFDPDRIGGLAFVYNQGFTGVLARAGLSDTDRSHVWLVLAFAASVYCLILAAVLARRGEDELSFLAASAIALLASPAAWIHHWVLTTVFILVFVVVGVRARSRLFLGLGVLGVLAQLPGPALSLPKTELRELDWSWWQVVYGNLSLIWLIVVLAVAWWLPLSRIRSRWAGGTDATADTTVALTGPESAAGGPAQTAPQTPTGSGVQDA